MSKWKLTKEQANIPLMAETLDISETTAQVMVNRHIRTKNTALKFLHPSPRFFNDPFLMKDMDKAVCLLGEAIKDGKRIAVFGDYDVDGVMSTVILYKTLKAAGAQVGYYIPHREHDGYGLNVRIVEALHKTGVQFLLTCDNGIAALAEIEKAKAYGMTVVVLDHHEPPLVETAEGITTALPQADAVVNPKQPGCPYPFKALCAGGIAYKLALAFHRHMNLNFNLEQEFLVLAMLATFCDIVDLQDENRIIAKTGLDILNQNPGINLGLYALIKAKAYENRPINEYAVGFIIGPCINATGRLEQADIAVNLLTSQNEEETQILAREMINLNEVRKQLTVEASARITELVEQTIDLKTEKVLVVLDPDTHESIAGIVAGRLKQAYWRPVLVLTRSGQWVKGSARSIEGYNLFESMSACKDLFERFGGHALAAGVTMAETNVDAVRQRLNAQCSLCPEDFTESLHIDEELSLEQVTYKLATELNRLAPFGKCNHEPLFLTRNLTLAHVQVLAEKNTLIFSLATPGNQRKMKAIGFGPSLVAQFQAQVTAQCGDYVAQKVMHGILRQADFMLDVVYTISINVYNGQETVQMKVKDFYIHAVV